MSDVCAYDPIVLRACVRYRYPLLVAWGTGWTLFMYHRYGGKLGDYHILLYGGRALLNDMPNYHAGSLHLYAELPILQVGPPVLVIFGVVARVTHYDQPTIAFMIMACSVVTVRAIEMTAMRVGIARERVAVGTLVGGFVLVAGWTAIVQFFHLEDAFAVMFIFCAIEAVSGSRRWWLCPLFTGLAIACKPWAVMVAPILLMLPPRLRLRAAVVLILAAIVPWSPFLIGDTRTASALSGLPEHIGPNSFIGALATRPGDAPEGLHIVMFIVGLGLATIAVHRGRWLAVPFVSFTARALLEPRFIPYYGVGPAAAGLLLDLVSPRRIPIWTMVTVAVEILLSCRQQYRLAGVALGAHAFVVIAVFVLASPEKPSRELADA